MSTRDVDEFERATVLIIDDDVTGRLTLSAMLKPDGYRIVFADAVKDVRARLTLINPDVIVCDVVMESMRGDEFFRWLKSHPLWCHVPVVAVALLETAAARAELLRAGAESALSKPCDARELRAHVHAALRTRRAYRRLAGEFTLAIME